MLDVFQRRRRVFGPAHPDTRLCRDVLSKLRTRLAYFARRVARRPHTTPPAPPHIS